MKDILRKILGVIVFAGSVYMGYRFAKRYQLLGGNFNRKQQPHREASKLSQTSNLTSRQQRILKVLHSSLGKAEMAIFLKQVKGVTERTLRRDLAVLINKKLVKKQGTTKSAKYFLL
ncbi:MAG TPA: hypothetical protein VJC17_02145 [Candidatus Dojkabacteria bacterium]|nr:hypothetical protein [Candidatus Dojkabacteria bacterium]